MRTVLICLLALGTLPAQQPNDARGWINQGVAAFKNAKYSDAVTAFQNAVNLEPSNVIAHLYLATSYMQQFIPGLATAENRDLASRAEAEFQNVLGLDATNKVAIASIASLHLNQKDWDEAKRWYYRLLTLDSNNADAYYSIGFIDWSQWYPAYTAARKQFGMRPEDVGPLPESVTKQELASKYYPLVSDGMANLRSALAINPRFDDAMAYMNLFLREGADLRVTREEYLRDVAEADQWVQKTLETKKQKAQTTEMRANVPPPPPPPPPPVGSTVPPRIMVGSDITAHKLVRQVRPVYPPVALEARISGVVRLKAVIAKDGTITQLQVISGHPMLVGAALDAVKQWVYQPTLLNGEPVEVATTIDVPFTLSQ